MSDDLKYWLALSFIEDIGPVTTKRLLSAFHSPERILKASIKELKDIDNIGDIKIKRIRGFDSWDIVEKEIKAIKRHGVRIIKYTDKQYPESLRNIEDAPVILYTKGDFIEEDKFAIAMVGSRQMTEYGKNIAYRLAHELSSMGLTIISGMARGIDTVSHMGALNAGGRSIAVLGTGIDRLYPPENKGLFKKITNSGCIVSEFHIGTPPNKENFPRRNRLISGLSIGVLVVEASIGSGSLITANYALEQGKEVFAIPGSIFSRYSEGTNALIKRGARLVQKTEDILEELAPQLKGLLKSAPQNLSKDMDRLEITDEEKAICNTLGKEPKHIDTIARETKMTQSRLLSLLLNLEIKGIVKQTDGKRFYI